jgi:hypothetical protein
MQTIKRGLTAKHGIGLAQCGFCYGCCPSHFLLSLDVFQIMNVGGLCAESTDLALANLVLGLHISSNTRPLAGRASPLLGLLSWF